MKEGTEIVWRLEVEWDRVRNTGTYSQHPSLEAAQDEYRTVTKNDPCDRWRIYRQSITTDSLLGMGEWKDE